MCVCMLMYAVHVCVRYVHVCSVVRAHAYVCLRVHAYVCANMRVRVLAYGCMHAWVRACVGLARTVYGISIY
jgi:hypothetical protein